jgi:hypothetical protein
MDLARRKRQGAYIALARILRAPRRPAIPLRPRRLLFLAQHPAELIPPAAETIQEHGEPLGVLNSPVKEGVHSHRSPDSLTLSLCCWQSNVQ